jgi:hypothetical protein
MRATEVQNGLPTGQRGMRQEATDFAFAKSVATSLSWSNSELLIFWGAMGTNAAALGYAPLR